MTAFEEFGVMPEIGQAVEEMEWTLPTDVQYEAIPMILGGGDVLMAAETGSGKTGAFCLPIIQIVHETLKDIQAGKGKKSGKSAAAVSIKCIMNVFDRDSAMAISPEGLLCQSRDQQGWHGCRSTKGIVNKGKYFYEATITDEGLCRVGWSSIKAALDLGTDKQGFGFGGTGKKSFAKQFDSYGESFGAKDTVGCFIDLDNATIKFSKNGKNFETAFTIPPHLKSVPLYAATVLKNAEISFNFGETPFKFPPKDGYIALCEAPKDCIINSEISGSTGGGGDLKLKSNSPQAIIIEPSRELAEQTFVQIKKFKKHLKDPEIRELLLIGGVSAKEQISVLQSGVDIVVGTPGRLEDLISTGQLSLSQVRFFVLDEADGLLTQGYTDLINRIHKQIPSVTPDGKRLQMIVCSATLHSFDVKKMAERLMHFPTWIDLKGEDSVPETVHHMVCTVDPTKDQSWKNLKRSITTDGVHEKDRINPSGTSPETLSEAVKILKGEYILQAINEHKMDKCLIFCRTKLDCDNLEQYLLLQGGGSRNPNNPYSCVCLHSDRKPAERKDNLQRFKDNKAKFLICTDVAARGIDITGMPFVINVTLPDEKSNYVHRIGRVGRAERMGLAISLSASVKEKVWYHSCPSRGKNCRNTRLADEGGCCIWYNEQQYLADIEEHLLVTIQQVDKDMKVQTNEFDGKVTYGQKKIDSGTGYQGHVASLASTVADLAQLEKLAQSSFLGLRHNKSWQR